VIDWQGPFPLAPFALQIQKKLFIFGKIFAAKERKDKNLDCLFSL